MSDCDPDEILMRGEIQKKLVEFMKAMDWKSPNKLVTPKMALVSFSTSGDVRVRVATGEELGRYVSAGSLQAAIQRTWSTTAAIACVVHNRDRDIYYACAYGRVYKGP